MRIETKTQLTLARRYPKRKSLETVSRLQPPIFKKEARSSPNQSSCFWSLCGQRPVSRVGEHWLHGGQLDGQQHQGQEEHGGSSMLQHQEQHEAACSRGGMQQHAAGAAACSSMQQGQQHAAGAAACSSRGSSMQQGQQHAAAGAAAGSRGSSMQQGQQHAAAGAAACSWGSSDQQHAAAWMQQLPQYISNLDVEDERATLILRMHWYVWLQ